MRFFASWYLCFDSLVLLLFAGIDYCFHLVRIFGICRKKKKKKRNLNIIDAGAHLIFNWQSFNRFSNFFALIHTFFFYILYLLF